MVINTSDGEMSLEELKKRKPEWIDVPVLDARGDGDPVYKIMRLPRRTTGERS